MNCSEILRIFFYFIKYIYCNVYVLEKCSKVYLYCKIIINVWFFVEILDVMWFCNKLWLWDMLFLIVSVYFSLFFIKLLGVNYYN